MSKKIIYAIVAVVLVIALAIGGSVFYFTSNNYAAKVDGQKITKAEYQFFLSLAKMQVSNTLGITDFKTKIGNKTAEEFIRDTAIEKATEYKIELIKAKENGVALSADEKKNVNDYFDYIIKQQSGGSKLEADKKIKSELGISLEEYQAIYKSYSLTQKFRSEEAKKMKASDEEIKKYYDENKDSIDTVTARHILISTKDKDNKDLPEDKKAEAKKKAEDILAKVNAGGDMKALAKELSEDPGVAQNEGEYKFTKSESYAPEFKDWAFKAKVGDTGIVKTDFGYHVMKLEAKKATFEEGKDTAKNGLISKKYSEQLDKWKKDPKFKAVKNDKVINSIKL